MQGPGSFSNLTVNTVVVFGPAGIPTGIFMYALNTTPALGNPPVAWISDTTTDPYGNVLPASTTGGFASRLGNALGLLQAGQLILGNTSFNTQGQINASGSGGPDNKPVMDFSSPKALSTDVQAFINMVTRAAGHVPVVSVSGDLGVSSGIPSFATFKISQVASGETDLISPAANSTDVTAILQMIAALAGGIPSIATNAIMQMAGLSAQRGTGWLGQDDTGAITNGIAASQGLAAGSFTRAPWDNVTTFLNGYTAGGTGPCRVKFMAENKMAFLELNLLPGTLADSTHCCTLPAPTGGGSYAPSANRNLAAFTRGGTAMTNGPFVQILAGGDVQVISMPTGATSVRVSGTYPLD